jgi:IS5 family transposase
MLRERFWAASATGTLDELQKAKNRVKARVRAKVEHPFQILNCIFGFEKVRYRGIQKNHHRLCASFALVNLLSAPQTAGSGEGVVSLKAA